MMSEHAAAQKNEVPAVARISRDIVRIHARLFERGPTRAKTIWRDEVVCCVLEDIFTRAERMLVDGGRLDRRDRCMTTPRPAFDRSPPAPADVGVMLVVS